MGNCNYKKSKLIGPGGINCNCCTRNPKGYSNRKKFYNRLYRRTINKKIIKLELNGQNEEYSLEDC